MVKAYPPGNLDITSQGGHFWRWWFFPFPKVGYVSSPGGYQNWCNLELKFLVSRLMKLLEKLSFYQIRTATTCSFHIPQGSKTKPHECSKGSHCERSFSFQKNSRVFASHGPSLRIRPTMKPSRTASSMQTQYLSCARIGGILVRVPGPLAKPKPLEI